MGDETRRRGASSGSVGELLTLGLVVVLVVVWDWGGHGGRHGGRHRDRVDPSVVTVVVDLEVERVVDWDAHGLHWFGDHVRDRLLNRDGSGGDGWTVELYNLKIRYR